MSLAAIETIRQAEEAAERARAETRAEGQKRVAEAEREGRALLENGKTQAAAESARMMGEAEQQAEKRRQEILAAAGEDCRSLAAAADANMAKAVEMIVRRVVES